MKKHSMGFFLVSLALMIASCAHSPQGNTPRRVAMDGPGGSTTYVEPAAPAAPAWLAHPCPQIKGTPFRKYQAFIMDGDVLKARTSETAAPVDIKDKGPHAGKWASVNEFLINKGIIKACQAAGIAVDDTYGVGSGTGNVGGTTPTQPTQPTEPRDRSGDGDYRPPQGNFAEPVNLDVDLYYQTLLSPASRPQVGADGRPKAFKQLLREFLSRPHIQEVGQADIAVAKCPTKLAKDTVCVTQKMHTYESARKVMFGDLDLRKSEDNGYEVFDYYCQQWMGQKEYSAVTNNENQMPGPGRIVTAALMNTEHTWPQSKFPSPKGSAGNLVEKTDLHHIFPTDTKVNAERSNYEFAEVDPATAKAMKCADGLLGKGLPIGDQTAKDSKYFQPPKNHKGDVARALFYFATRYGASMSAYQEAYLRRWHQEDPADDREKERNVRIYRNMGLRNPFVDHPEFVEKISRF